VAGVIVIEGSVLTFMFAATELSVVGFDVALSVTITLYWKVLPFVGELVWNV
jgi:hypothetical protein